MIFLIPKWFSFFLIRIDSKCVSSLCGQLIRYRDENPFDRKFLIQALFHNRHSLDQLLQAFDRQVGCLHRDQYPV